MPGRRCRTLTLLVSALAAGIAFAQPRTVTVWGLGVGPDSKGQDAVARAFEAKYPQYKLRILKMGAGEMNPQKLMTSIVGNVPPDVIHQDRFTISDWAARGAFVPLDPLIERDRATDPLTPTPDQYYPAAWSEAQFQGKTYGIPNSADDRILYYNKSVFRRRAADLRAAGLDPERPPRTWSEVLAYSKVLTEYDAGGKLKVAGFIPNFGNSWLYLYAFQNNAQFMSADGKTCTLASPEAKEALEFMIAGYKLLGGYDKAEQFQSGFQSNENDPFYLGKVVMKVDGDWTISPIGRYAPSLDFGVAPPPVPDDRYHRKGRFSNEREQFVTWIGGFSYAIPSGCKNVEGGWAFIKFALSEEGRIIEAKAARDWERLRGREFVARIVGHKKTNERLSKEFRPNNPRLAAAFDMHVQMAPFGRIRPASVVAQVLWDEHVRALQRACKGEVSPQEALEDGQARVQTELDAYFQYFNRPTFDFRVPVAVAGAMFIGFVGWIAWWLKRKNLGRLQRTESAWAAIFVSPWIFGFLLLTLGPMLASLVFSFTQFNVLTEAKVAGMDNYAAIFSTESQNLIVAFGNVAYLAVLGIPLGLATGLAIAMLLNSDVRAIRTYRTLFYMPSIVPVVASAVLWNWILKPDSQMGLVNSIWAGTIQAWLGIEPPGWLSVAPWAKPALIVMGLWGAGGGMIFWLAGLKGIPKTLYEAAQIDGATPWRQFWSVTLPVMSPFVFFNTVTGLIGALQEFDRVYILRGTSGTAGPSDSLLTPVLHLFVNGFSYFKMGFASALAWIVFLIILLLTLVQFKLAPRWVHEESGK